MLCFTIESKIRSDNKSKLDLLSMLSRSLDKLVCDFRFMEKNVSINVTCCTFSRICAVGKYFSLPRNYADQRIVSQNVDWLDYIFTIFESFELHWFRHTRIATLNGSCFIRRANCFSSKSESLTFLASLPPVFSLRNRSRPFDMSHKQFCKAILTIPMLIWITGAVSQKWNCRWKWFKFRRVSKLIWSKWEQNLITCTFVKFTLSFIRLVLLEIDFSWQWRDIESRKEKNNHAVKFFPQKSII